MSILYILHDHTCSVNYNREESELDEFLCKLKNEHPDILYIKDVSTTDLELTLP